MPKGALAGIKVLDFSTLLPGPLATLMLAAAGAEIIKIERPGRGDEMRSYEPKFGNDSVNFALLNRGKRSIAIDLKDPRAIETLKPLLRTADVVVEQFRPGVMERLGLGYDALHALNPRIIYCAITGYGQSGPRAAVAAHDINFVAEAGMLGLAAGSDGAPVVPAALVADIGGGTYPAVINILLALRERDRSGEGCKLDIAMADNLFTFMYWALGNKHATGASPRAGGELLTGGSPRYNVYETSDGRFIAAAPLEDKFWENFCDAIGLESGLRNDRVDPRATKEGVQKLIRSRTAAEWRRLLSGRDVCCSLVASLEEALGDAHFAERKIFMEKLTAEGRIMPALPVPIASCLRAAQPSTGYPDLGADNPRAEGCSGKRTD